LIRGIENFVARRLCPIEMAYQLPDAAGTFRKARPGNTVLHINKHNTFCYYKICKPKAKWLNVRRCVPESTHAATPGNLSHRGRNKGCMKFVQRASEQ
jgi:hypothetical protein